MSKLYTKLAKSLRMVAILAVLAAVLVTGVVSADPAYLVRLSGSTTLQPFAEDSEPQFEFAFSDTNVTVAGGGSSIGVKDICNNAVEVGNASRELKSSDCEGASPATTYARADLDKNVVARDGVCVIVRDVPEMDFLSCITKGELDMIYEQSCITKTNWSDINAAWPARPVVARARSTDSGTRASFMEMVGITAALEEAVIACTGQPRLPGNPDVAAAIAGNTDHIGYVGLGFIDTPGIRVVPVTLTAGGACITCSYDNVNNGTYPLGRGLNMFTLKPDVDPDDHARIADYINWMLSPAGQALVEGEGFVAVQPPAPDWDINTDHGCNIGDVVSIGLAWSQTGAAGWLRQDANNDGSINIGDVVFVGLYWSQTW